MPEGRLLVSYRPTLRQRLGRTGYVAALVGAAAVLVAVIVIWSGYRSGWLYLLVIPVVAVGCLVALSQLWLRGGVDATEHGLRRMTRRSRGARFAPWSQILDIRTERRGRRTVVVVCLTTGTQWRLRAPYDGRWLSHDPDFEPKLFNLRNLWETYRTRHVAIADDASAPRQRSTPPQTRYDRGDTTDSSPSASPEGPSERPADAG